MLNPAHTTPQRGFSLVELMVAVTIGLLLLAAVSQVYVNTVNTSSDTLKVARVNQALRAAMDVMVRDIQRAGYNFSTTSSSTGAVNSNPFMTGAEALQISGSTAANASGSCITYTYDRDSNSTVDNEERMAFYLNIDPDTNIGAISMRNGGTSVGNSCAPNAQQRIIDQNQVNITALNFALTTHCINTSVAPTSSTNYANTDCTVNTPTTGDTLIKPRQVTISITGQPTKNGAAWRRTITDTVHIRNNLVCTAPC